MATEFLTLLAIGLFVILATVFAVYFYGVVPGVIISLLFAVFLASLYSDAPSIFNPIGGSRQTTYSWLSYLADTRFWKAFTVCFFIGAMGSIGADFLFSWFKGAGVNRTFFLIWLAFLILPPAVIYAYFNVSALAKVDPLEDQGINRQQTLNVLRSEFKQAMENKSHIRSFLQQVDAAIASMVFAQKFSFELASFTTKLLIDRLKANDNQLAEHIINHYIDNVLPRTGINEKSMDVAANAIAFAIIYSRVDVFRRVEIQILGENFDITTTHNGVLLFNLAAYYAVNNDRERLFKATRQALLHGKKAEQFRTDKDFEPYWSDPEFIALIDGG